MSSPKFPKVFRQGQTRTTIYKTPVRGADAFTVVWYEGRTRKRKVFADLGAAELHAQAKVIQLSRGEARVVALSGEELLAFNRANEAIKEFGVSLDTVAVEYRDAKRLIRGASLVEAARYYAAQRLLDIPRKTVGEVYEELIQAKRDEGCSERYVADLKSRLGRFARAFPKLISAVTGAEIRAWLQGLEHETPKMDRSAPRRRCPTGRETISACASRRCSCLRRRNGICRPIGMNWHRCRSGR